MMSAMAATFPRTRRAGYDPEQVERFLTEARRSYSAEPGSRGALRAEQIRAMAFRMRRGGYEPRAVDAALERLEDVFAQRERDRALAEAGDRAWFARARATAQAILDRAARPDGERFRRVGPFTIGYHPADVDRFAGRLVGYFQHDRPLAVEEVRQVVFRPKRGGYLEEQVDMLLDAVTDVMLAVR
jgi:DivIVA domain-containing protein